MQAALHAYLLFCEWYADLLDDAANTLHLESDDEHEDA